MSALLPAALLGMATAVAVGLPAPRRRAVLGARPPLRLAVPPAVPVLLGGLVAVPVLGPVGAAVAVGLALLARRAWHARAKAKEHAAERASAAEAMTVLAGELRAGRTPVEALRRAAAVAVGPVRDGLDGAATAAAFGGVPAEALRLAAERSAVPEVLNGLAVCWTVCQGTGSSLAGAVDRLEEGLREDALRRQEVAAELAGPRSTALMLAVLPVVGLLMGMGMGAHPLHVLLHTKVGNGCLVLGVALDLAGVWVTGRLVRGVLGSAA